VFIVIDDTLKHHQRATGPGGWVTGETVEEVLAELGCESLEAGVETIWAYNAATDSGDFDSDALDGNRTEGLELEKSNWALPINDPPYYGYRVTGEITFGFGSVATDERARALDTTGQPIPGLYVAGNTTSGLLYDNYPSGTGLANDAVFGRIAAEEAATQLISDNESTSWSVALDRNAPE